ncbi:hypothetical protein HK105_203046 [Polyrhizophydium stewartii]|uniref:Uncharacterized protein n=1 Tax=Polyrhizophydium stewartii TaxID=2732419 RepID=A0ABR4ND00_9FUNG|nr:hypothetical protein HK105_007900 [Polyrhizophydium stewartii]
MRLSIFRGQSNPRDECAIQTRFRVRGHTVVVTRDGVAWSEPDGKRSYVGLGTPEHMRAIGDRIIELQAAIVEASLIEHKDVVVQERRERLAHRLRSECAQRTSELLFLRYNLNRLQDKECAFSVDFGSCDMLEERRSQFFLDDVVECRLAPGVRDRRTPLTLSTHQFDADALESSDFSEDVAPDISLEENVLHVTSDSFNRIQKFRTFDINPKEGMFQRPRIRQFLHKDILHQSSLEIKTTWAELLVDLVFVVVIGKTDRLIGITNPTWGGFNKFAVITIPIFQHWRAVTMYNNHFFHEDFYHKILMFVLLGGIVLMGTSITNAFDLSYDYNTSSIFLLAYMFSRIFVATSSLVVGTRFETRFRKTSISHFVGTAISMVPFMVVFFISCDGTNETQVLRMAIWWAGNILEFAIPGIIGLVLGSARETFRITFNVEHMADRHGAFFVIAVGELVSGFLVDARFHLINLISGLTLMGVLMATNFNHIYFRIEGTTHFRHALRRDWAFGYAWIVLHFPLYVCIVSLSVTTYAFIWVGQRKYVAPDALLHVNISPSTDSFETLIGFEFRTVYATSFAVIYFCLGALRLLHIEKPPKEPAAVVNAALSRVVTRAGRLSMSQPERGFSNELSGGQLDESRRSRLTQAPRAAPSAGGPQKQTRPHVSRRARIYINFGIGVVMLACGLLIKSMPPEGWLGLGAGLSSLGVLVEEWGRIKA